MQLSPPPTAINESRSCPTTSSIGPTPMKTVARLLTRSQNDATLHKLPTFSGDILEWPTFINKYRKTTEDFHLTEDVNHERLKAALRGSAKELVELHMRRACHRRDERKVRRPQGGDRPSVPVDGALSATRPPEGTKRVLLYRGISI